MKKIGRWAVIVAIVIAMMPLIIALTVFVYATFGIFAYTVVLVTATFVFSMIAAALFAWGLNT